MKKIISAIGLITAAVIFSILFSHIAVQSVFADTTQTAILQIGNPVINIDGSDIPIDENGTAPVIINDRTMLPIRALIEAFGGVVKWEENERDVLISYENRSIRLNIDSTDAYIDDILYTLDTAPVIVNDRTMLPIRFIAENLGFNVEWKDAAQEVVITKSFISVNLPDGCYLGSSHCTNRRFINYIIDVGVEVKDGRITAIHDRTLKEPMSSRDKRAYNAAIKEFSEKIEQGMSYTDIDAVSSATLSSINIKRAINNAVSEGTIYDADAEDNRTAPEGISLYGGIYPVMTMEDNKITDIQIVKGSDTSDEAIEIFNNQLIPDIIRTQDVHIDLPEESKAEAYTLTSLIEQILYKRGVINE